MKGFHRYYGLSEIKQEKLYFPQCGEKIRKLARHLPYVKIADIFGGADYRGQFRELRLT